MAPSEDVEVNGLHDEKEDCPGQEIGFAAVDGFDNGGVTSRLLGQDRRYKNEN
jgi:hypothetical protein